MDEMIEVQMGTSGYSIPLKKASELIKDQKSFLITWVCKYTGNVNALEYNFKKPDFKIDADGVKWQRVYD